MDSFAGTQRTADQADDAEPLYTAAEVATSLHVRECLIL